MIASGVVCQTWVHNGYGWCVSLLTLLAMGVQGQDVKEPWAPYNAAELRTGVSRETPELPPREPLGGTTKAKQEQTAAPGDDSRCEKTEIHMERVERSLLFLTAAQVVCQIGDHEWYGVCVLTLEMLASGDLGVQAEEKNGPSDRREKRVANQEEDYLEAYDCNELEEVMVHNIP